MNKPLLFTTFLFIINLSVFSQNYPKNYFRQPLKGELKVTGNFCEFRSNHFHGGLDLRTSGTGHAIYAIADGYVSRINVSSDGYGYSIYLTHPKGYKSVYGHLSRYTTKIQNWIKDKQIQAQTFALDLELDSTIFPVKKGQIIAYSGNSGRSFGPHLHFEIRNLLDEPLNPQLFGFNIKDTKPPVITKIAVYPASENSYVNGHNYSRVITVKNNKLNNQITVHGEIYFGIEAFDYLNIVSNRNAIYSTKLYVDGKLIYFSEFNKFSYEYNRDINSLVDYKRRKLKNWRIQRCFVDPNNNLYHYKQVENNGILKFNDDKNHSIKFTVADVYGNKSSLYFYVKSSSKEKIFPKTKNNLNILKYDTTNLFIEKGIEIFFPKQSLFNNVPLNYYTSVGNKYSPIYHIGSEYYALKKPMILSLSVSGVPLKYREKSIICFLDFNNKKSTYSGNLKNDYLSAEVKEFGRYYVDIDTVAPKISPYNISNKKNMSKYNSIKIKISDKMSGISNWAIFVNGQWVLSSYDAKNNLITYYFDDKTKKGKNEFYFLVSDKTKNYSSYKAYFYR